MMEHIEEFVHPTTQKVRHVELTTECSVVVNHEMKILPYSCQGTASQVQEWWDKTMPMSSTLQRAYCKIMPALITVKLDVPSKLEFVQLQNISVAALAFEAVTPICMYAVVQFAPNQKWCALFTLHGFNKGIATHIKCGLF